MSRTAVDGTELRCELFYANPNVTHPKFADTLVYDPSGMTITIYNEEIFVSSKPSNVQVMASTKSCV